ncbi:isochorismatase family protein [Lentzea sp. NPDC058450]|uniref:isochorismatase family protein n=1 Tax=Lentzea sp. NPDC058450 TaxID=3346505 RepID=UPI003646F3DC
MSLPRLADYTPPTALPASRARWTPHRDRAALLVHDMQEYFVRAYPADSVALTQAVTSIARVLATARAAGLPVYYTAQPGDQDPQSRGLLWDLWGPGIRAADTEIIAALAPREGETVLTKHRYSAFARSDFEQLLRAQGRDQLVVTGVYAEVGVLATAVDAFSRDIAPFVVADAVAGFDRPGHVRALDQAASHCAVVTTTDALCDALAPTLMTVS